MNWENFVEELKETLDIPDDVEVSKDETLHDSEYWSSMHALLIMALAESKYNISISGEELRNSETMGDLYKLFKDKA